MGALRNHSGERPGTRLGRYTLLVPIGVGGMGQVWIGEQSADHAFRRTVAVKLIRGEHVRDAAFRSMFLAEARIASRVAHANVVEVVDLGEEDSVLYQVMEYVEGDSLAQLLARSKASTPVAVPSPIGVVARIVVDALRGLHAAHQATDDRGALLGLIHRDVSPHNVLVGVDGIARIADFGIAKLLGDLASETQVGQVKGKPGYMSPEQSIGARLDRRSDLYAMGVVAWEAFTGRRLHPGGAVVATPAPASDLRPELDPRMAAAVAKALAHDVDARFSTAEEMADALESTALCATSRDVAGWVKELAGVSLEARREEVREVARGLAGAHDESSARAAEGRTVSEVAARELATSTSTTSSPSGWALAVLPFRYRGPPADEYLAEAFGDELIDVLSRTASLRVYSSGAVAHFKSERDPTVVRKATGADVIVDATLQRTGAQLRIAVRLIDAMSGVQMWSEPFDGAVEDSFALQETMSRRIAEALRVELSVRSTVSAVPADAVTLCLRARRRLRAFRVLGPDGAIDLLDQCLALAPGLAPAVAARAIAAVRASFLPAAAGTEAVDQGSVSAAVQRALAEAPGLAETHFAAGLFALHIGDLAEAAARLGRALSIAPHYPDALSLLGTLECETGRSDRGRARLELAFELSPDVFTAYALAYHHALHGRDAAMERIRESSEAVRDSTGLVALEMRVAAWRGDDARVEKALLRLRANDRAEMLEPYVRILREPVLTDEVDERHWERARSLPNLRARTNFLQIGAEAFALRKDHARAERYLEAAAKTALLDLDWLDYCPALAGLRGGAVFEAARALVTSRASALRED